MKKTRRLLIEVEHSELTVTVRNPQSSAVLVGGIPEVCPTCGWPRLLPYLESARAHPGGPVDLNQALASGEVHLAAGGRDIWICEKSLNALFQNRGLNAPGSV